MAMSAAQPYAAAAYLSINNVEVIYDHVILVLKGVSLHVPEGKIVTLLGANGAGKTTTLKAISNLLRAERGDVTKGTIEFMGQRVDRLTPNELVRMGVCQVMEGRHCFQHLTVEENLLTGAFTRNIKRAELKRDLELVYTYFPRLKERRGSQSGYTSGGEQQMTAIGRALMARPKMILLDEPSMGLAPQLVEEIFEIVRNLNVKERVSFLLAEQNTMVALRFADYGYILENGRVVMDGAAADLAQNEDVKEFYLGLSTAGRKSFRDVKHYRRRKRWLACARFAATEATMADYFDTLEIRDPEEREREQLARLPRQIAYAKAHAPAFARILADVDVASITTRAALAQLPVTRKSALLELQKSARPFGGLAATGWGDAVRVFASPGPIYEPEGRRPDYWRLARALFAAGFPPRRSRPQLFFVPLHAGGIDAGNGRARARLHGVSGRHRADRAAGAGDGRAATHVLRGHAVVSPDHSREGGRDGHCAAQPRQGARIRGAVSEEPLRRALSPAASPAIRSMHRPTSARSPTRRRRAKGSSSTKACSWKSSGPAPATRSLRAKSARSS